MQEYGTPVYNSVEKVIDEAMDEYPWDAGFRIDFYRSVAADLLELAEGLEEDVNDGRPQACC